MTAINFDFGCERPFALIFSSSGRSVKHQWCSLSVAPFRIWWSPTSLSLLPFQSSIATVVFSLSWWLGIVFSCDLTRFFWIDILDADQNVIHGGFKLRFEYKRDKVSFSWFLWVGFSWLRFVGSSNIMRLCSSLLSSIHWARVFPSLDAFSRFLVF